ncbi:MAG: NADPH-dependent assimilatory sulfite reductase hemoprotein subunit [Alphaproteobacteria bacterium]|nr:NADPH-dependent assimilatory sulfite reductase hemoprotein subunit [Alphaproteobacteria bacterium]
MSVSSDKKLAAAKSTPEKSTKAKNPSAVEGIKYQSQALRGGLADGLLDAAPVFADGDDQLIKFHGLYQGYNRDTATVRKQAGLDKEHEFMARVRAPGGRLSAAQYLVLDELADQYGGGKLRLTSRQGVQFHGLAKSDLVATLSAINRAVMTTFAACGDVVRNVTITPSPITDRIHDRLNQDARLLSTATLPRTRAYLELWGKDEAGKQLDLLPLLAEFDYGSAVELAEQNLLPEGTNQVGATVADPLYGSLYLPRKFKIGLATVADNSIDVLTNDLAIIPVFAGDQRLEHYIIAVGGGFGMSHNRADTFPRLATPVCVVGDGELLAITRAVIGLQRDHGDRADRKRARLKYLVADRGIDWIKQELDQRMGRVLDSPPPLPSFAVRDHLGWHRQTAGQTSAADERFYYGIVVPSGRIHDTETQHYRRAIRQIVEQFSPDLVVTPGQDLIFANLPPESRTGIDRILNDHGIPLPEGLPPVVRWSMACVALPSCNLALTEAERVQPQILEQLYASLSHYGLGAELLSVRITGCPNGCVRPYNGDIGIVGRVPGFYAIFVGGDFGGTRMNSKLVERVPMARLGEALAPIFAAFAAEKSAGQGFGDWCHGVGLERLTSLLPPFALEAGGAAKRSLAGES